jgi:CRP/FNR family cyclic AMP-dependent transcriptional regulator
LFLRPGRKPLFALLSAGDFVGEESLAAIARVRLATATAVTACTTLKINRQEVIHVMHEEHSFSDLFMKFMLVS